MNDSNMSLRFDLEDGKVQAGLKQVEAAERKLEAAVTQGNRTQKVRLKTEGDLAKALDVLARHEAAVARESNRREQQTKRTTKAIEKEAIETKGAATSMGAAAVASGKLAGGLAGIAAGALSAASAMRGLIALHEHQMDLARRSDQQARGLKEFIALQAPGVEGQEHARKALLKGASMGLKPEDAARIAQPIQSVVDADGDGRLDAKEMAKFDEDVTAAFRLGQLGISADDAQTVVTAGRSKGRGGTESADKLIAAADLSAAGPADFARSASAMGQFEDQDTALAVVTALTQEEKNFGQIPTLVRGAAVTLGSAADESEFSKKYGLKGLSEAEKIAKLREIGAREGKGKTADERIADFSRGFKNAGLDEEKARALGILVRQGESVASTRAKLGAIEPGLTAGKVAGLEADPVVGSSMAAEKAAAMTAYNQLYGPESEAARDKRAAALARGAALTRKGASIGVDQETGEAKAWWKPDRIFGDITAAGRNIRESGGMYSRDDNERLAVALDKLGEKLDRNTTATETNSAAAQRVAPVGGNPANAEEKY